jgi:hypothetical protein
MHRASDNGGLASCAYRAFVPAGLPRRNGRTHFKGGGLQEVSDLRFLVIDGKT